MNDDKVTMRRFSWSPYLLVAIVMVVFVVWWWFCHSQPITTVFVVRHADKAGPSTDALHDPLGIDRAAELARVLGKAGVTAVYHSNTNRTRLTAEPLALAMGLTPTEYPAQDTTQLAQEILADHRGGRILVVGHSNTLSDIVAAFGGAAFGDLDETDYDNLFSITICPCASGSPQVVQLEFGAVTPP